TEPTIICRGINGDSPQRHSGTERFLGSISLLFRVSELMFFVFQVCASLVKTPLPSTFRRVRLGYGHQFPSISCHGGRMLRLKVNGKDMTFDGDPNMPLLWYLRDVAGLTGTKFGCGMALCGACTVHQNGEAIRSCSTAMKDVSGAEIVTIEGTAPMHPVQKAWMEIRVP